MGAKRVLAGGLMVSLAAALLLGTATAAMGYSFDGQRFVYNTNYCYYASSIPSTWQSSSALANARSAWNNAGSPFRLYYDAGGANYMYAANMGADNGALATTWHITHPNPNQPLLHTDGRIRFNTYYSWSTSGESTKYDVQSAATHEIGHWLQLGHSSTTSATMWSAMGKGETIKRTLAMDDINGINAAY